MNGAGQSAQKPTIDPDLFAVGLLPDIAQAIAIQVQATVATGGLHGREGDLPGLGGALVHLHVIAHIHVERDITGGQEVIGKILLDHVALAAATHDEIVHGT